MSCPFCERVERGAVSRATDASAAFPDAYPLTEGHTLVVPKRHVVRLADLAPAELSDLWALAARVRQSISAADGFNIGVNDGESAGQTVPHVHLHVIPRRTGDVDDPRGGIGGSSPIGLPTGRSRDARGGWRTCRFRGEGAEPSR
jgi:ATP adenylyltransferase